jgi:hypothetical protein
VAEPNVDARGAGMTRRTKALGIAGVAAAGSLVGAELRRIWRMGSLPEQQGTQAATPRQRMRRMVRIVREGYAVSRVRRNAVFNMLFSFMVTLAAVRAITVRLHTRGAIGPIRNVVMGDRHVHHFVPGMVLCMVSGGVALSVPDERLRQWLAIPFGGGVALVLDETALLLELEDVYWSEEGVLSLQVAFMGMALLAGAGYGVQLLRAGSARLVAADWAAAARAWEDLSRLSGEPV